MADHGALALLPQVVSDPALNKSGVYWSWDNDKSSLWFDSVDGALENRVSEEVRRAEAGTVGSGTRIVKAAPGTAPGLSARAGRKLASLHTHCWFNAGPPLRVQVSDDKKGAKLWDVSAKLVGLAQ